MIGKASVILLVFALSVAQAADALAGAASQANPLVGTWRLVRYADTPRGGKTVSAFGEAPIGQFVFTNDGHMSVHIMHNPPAPKDAVVDLDPDACIPSWYCGYFGTYTFNAREGSWVTHVLGGNIVAYVGTDQKRSFKITRGKLIISETYMAGDVPVTAERVLVRDERSRGQGHGHGTLP
jgi:hypothetical protein